MGYDPPLTHEIPADECNGALEYLRIHGHSVQAENKFPASCEYSPRFVIDGKSMSSAEMAALAVEEGWVKP